MARLEGHGHEQRFARVRRGFKRSSAGFHEVNIPTALRKSAGAFGLLALGAGIGVSGFILLESIQRPDGVNRKGFLAEDGAHYRSCRDAIQDGRANILRGEPGYRPALDADGDGLACEPYVPINR